MADLKDTYFCPECTATAFTLSGDCKWAECNACGWQLDLVLIATKEN